MFKTDGPMTRAVFCFNCNKMIMLGDEFPDFEADTSHGRIRFHDYIKGSWAILLSHPADFTPVCTTELGRAAHLKSEFMKRGVKMAALSCDNVESHIHWIQDIRYYSNIKGEFPFPIISDPKRELAILLGMLDPDEKDSNGLPLTCRAVFIIGPDKRLKLSILYPATTGRNFDEVLRVIDSLQLTARKRVATPVSWKRGGNCMVLPSIPEREAKKIYTKGIKEKQMPSGRRYMRFTPQP